MSRPTITILSLILLYAGTSTAAPLNPDADPPTKPVSITGYLRYGCGPTHGTGCFLVTTKANKSYVIGGNFPDVPESALEFLNRAKDQNKPITITGQLMKESFQGYRIFDLSYIIDAK